MAESADLLGDSSAPPSKRARADSPLETPNADTGGESLQQHPFLQNMSKTVHNDDCQCPVIS